MKQIRIFTRQTDDLQFDIFIFQFTDEEKKEIKKVFEKWIPDYQGINERIQRKWLEPPSQIYALESSSGEELTDEKERENYRKLLEPPELLKFKSAISNKKISSEIREQLLDSFINELEIYADIFLQHFQNKSRIPSYIENVKDVVNHLRETKRYLKNLYMGDLYFPRLTRINDSHGKDGIINLRTAIETVDLSREAEKPIERLLNILEDNLVTLERMTIKTGRPSADINSGLVDEIAKLFQADLNITPTTYQDGLFSQLIRNVFKILEIESEYPSRLIKSAIKKLH